MTESNSDMDKINWKSYYYGFLAGFGTATILATLLIKWGFSNG